MVGACLDIIDNSGWGTLQEVAMKRATAADFEAAIRGMDIDTLRRFMRRIIEMRLHRAPRGFLGSTAGRLKQRSAGCLL